MADRAARQQNFRQSGNDDQAAPYCFPPAEGFICQYGCGNCTEDKL